MSNCFHKKRNQYKQNKIIPLPQIKEEKLFISNQLFCSGCKRYFDDLEKFIICGGCNEYFHCKIAGECIGRNCMNPGFDGNIYRTKYCYNCISKVYDFNKCLCKTCQL